MVRKQLKCPNSQIVSKARNGLVAVHEVFGPNKPLQEVKAELRTVQAYGAGAALRVVAAAKGIAYLNDLADSNGVGVQNLANAIKFPNRRHRSQPFLAKVAKLAKELPAVLDADDAGADSVVETFEASGAEEADDAEMHELEAAFGSSKRDEDLRRLQSAVNEQLETVRWAREETEIAMDKLEDSFRALIKAKDAQGDD